MKRELLAAVQHPPVKMAEPARLDPAISVANAFDRLLRQILAHWQVNQAAALAGQDEGIHQLRVAIRHMKTLFYLFRPYIAATDYEVVRNALTRFGKTLGGARDWDVFGDLLLANAATYRSTQDASREAAVLARPIRNRSHRQVVDMIKAPFYSSFLAHMRQRLDERRWLGKLKGEQAGRFSDASPILLDRQLRGVRQSGRHIAGLSAERRHDLRKKMKKLGYSVEFVAGIHGEHGARRYAKRISRVLDVLGDLNDLAMADSRLAEASGSGSNANRSARLLRKRWRRQRAKRLDLLPGVWGRFKKAERFWRNGRATADAACQ
ncbi:MAG: CHAD domain-containing protein [Pseudomonadota bacterium]